MLIHNQNLDESPAIDIYLYLWSLQVGIYLTEGSHADFFLQSEVEKLQAWPGIELTTHRSSIVLSHTGYEETTHLP